MAIQDKVTLIGADNPGADTLFEGFTKVNDNMDNLLDNDSAVNSGATQIGYYNTNTTTPTTVQAALDNITYDETNGVTDGANVGAGTGELYRDKTTKYINIKTIVAGTNMSLTNGADTVTLNSGLSNASNVTLVASSQSPYTLLSDDEIVLIDTEDAAFQLDLPAGTDKRIVNIKNLAWTGTGASPTNNTTEVSIIANTGTPDYVEDDRTGLPSVGTAIGPGSAMRLVFDSTAAVWSII